AIGDDVDADVVLALHDFGHRAPYPRLKSALVVRLALEFGVHQVEELDGSRETPRMRSQHAVRAAPHPPLQAPPTAMPIISLRTTLTGASEARHTHCVDRSRTRTHDHLLADQALDSRFQFVPRKSGHVGSPA